MGPPAVEFWEQRNKNQSEGCGQLAGTFRACGVAALSNHKKATWMKRI
jgi:hypothetical protein